MNKRKKKIAILACTPPGKKRLFKGRERTVGEVIAYFVENKSDHAPAIFQPPKDSSDFPDAKAIDALIIPGSPYNWDEQSIRKRLWMRRLLDFIRDIHAVIPDMPVLGICFGHQAIAKAMGAQIVRFGKDIVARTGARELSLTMEGSQDRLFDGVPKNFMAMFTHSYYVGGLLDNAVLLAKNQDVPVQSFRVGSTIYGVQFHPDYDTELMEQIVQTDIEKLRNAGLSAEGIDIHPKLRHDQVVLDNFLKLVAII